MHPSLAVHAGAWLKSEIVEPHGITVKALAAHLGVSRQGLSNLLNGHGGLSAYGVMLREGVRREGRYAAAHAACL
jgi:plasmid maintenance system antidote protein VapI